MKCIKNQSTGEIRRVKDEVAYELESKGWRFIPKSEWKLATRPETTNQPKEKVVNSEGKVRRNREKRDKR